MASQQSAVAPSGATHTAGSPQQLNQIVMEYLSKKGYSKTEAMLRVESAYTDADGRPIISNPEDYPDAMYERAYCECEFIDIFDTMLICLAHLRRWIDNSLDIYKVSFRFKFIVNIRLLTSTA
jgi:transcription initiation factor TFIID subunit 5